MVPLSWAPVSKRRQAVTTQVLAKSYQAGAVCDMIQRGRGAYLKSLLEARAGGVRAEVLDAVLSAEQVGQERDGDCLSSGNRLDRDLERLLGQVAHISDDVCIDDSKAFLLGRL